MRTQFHYHLLVIGLLSLLPFTGCRHDREPNKIIDGLPVSTSETVWPAVATQQVLAAADVGLIRVHTILNRVGFVTTPDYSDLTGPDGSSRYTFPITSAQFGAATVSIQFRDVSNAVINPIVTHTSTAAMNALIITITGNSTVFSYSHNLTLLFDTTADFNSIRRVSGTAHIASSDNSIDFTIAAPGLTTAFEGITSGQITGTGTGPGAQTTSVSLSFNSDRTSNGSISWEGKSGTLRFNKDMTGLVVSDQKRILIN